MAPRSGKRRRRVRNPIPVWLPLPRPCLRSLNLPGPPYYIPISPEMYLPPWALPPFYTKPMCHCANEDFCTTSNCQNSTECLKMHPIFCPRGTKQEETSDSRQNLTHQQQQQNFDEQESSDLDINICSACGGHPSNLRTLGKKKYSQQDKQPQFTSKVIRTQDSFTSPHNVEQHNQCPDQNINFERNKIFIDGKRVTSRKKNNIEEINHISHETVRSGLVDKSCQTSLSNLCTGGNDISTTHKKGDLNSSRRNKRFSESSSSYAENSESSGNKNVTTYSDAYNTPNNIVSSEVNYDRCVEPHGDPADDSEQNVPKPKPNMNKELVRTTKKRTSDTIHVDQLSDQLSKGRRRQANKFTGCCFPGSEETCKTDMEIDTIEKNFNITKSHKKSDCSCYSSNPLGKRPSKSRKLSECICSSTKIPLKETSRFRKASKCECSPSKKSRKHSSRSDKSSECECSSTKITQKKSSHLRKVSECSCPSTDLLREVSSKNRKDSESGFSSAERNNPNRVSSTKLTIKKSNKSVKDDTSSSVTNVKRITCQCKFPPAYKHLSCSGNLRDNCSCTNNN